MKLIIAPGAAADLERLQEFIASTVPAAGERVFAVLSRAIQSLDALPERGRLSAVSGARD